MQRIGLIGIGNIGSYFLKLLREKSCEVVALDSDEGKMAAAVAGGAAAAATPAEVAERSDLILLCLPGSHAVEVVMEGERGLLSALRAGQLVVDTGTTHPATDIHYAKLCAERGAGLLDAPITGRDEGFIMMVGGSAQDFEHARDVLSVLSYKLKHIGAVGKGQVLKLANQMVLAGQWAVWAEAVAWAERAGVEPRLLKDYLEFPMSERLFGEDFSGGGTLALHYKDLGYVLELAHECGANIPLTSIVHEAFKAAKAGGDADWSQPGVVTYWRRLNARAGA